MGAGLDLSKPTIIKPFRVKVITPLCDKLPYNNTSNLGAAWFP